jgi:Ca2+-binding EF-hand superfamily protein
VFFFFGRVLFFFFVVVEKWSLRASVEAHANKKNQMPSILRLPAAAGAVRAPARPARAPRVRLTPGLPQVCVQGEEKEGRGPHGGVFRLGIASPPRARSTSRPPPFTTTHSQAAPSDSPSPSSPSPSPAAWTPEARASYDRLLAAFSAADADGNGLIDRSELTALLESTAGGLECPLHARGWLPPSDVDAILAQYDRNGDGVIDFEEFTRLADDGVLLAHTLADYAAAFAALDTGGNGRLGPTELAELMRGLGRPLAYDDLVRLMRDFDADASGQLEFGEWLRLCRSFLSLDEVLAYMRLAPTEATVQARAAAAAASSSPSSNPTNPAVNPAVNPEGVADVFSGADLDRAIAAAGPTGVTLLLSSVTWCRPCRAMATPLKKLAAAYGPGTPSNVGFYRLYGNASNEAKALFKERLGTKVTPTWFIFSGNDPKDPPIHTHTGTNKAKLEHAVREAVAAAKGEGALPPEALYPPEPKPTGGW